VLMVMVDDATNDAGMVLPKRNHAGQLRRVGRLGAQAWAAPSLYVDRDSIYRCEGVAALPSNWQKAAQTQFGRAMGQLGID